ncbi:Bicupin, oxalate decarboxylase/oxidase [Ceraceosorus guamensis]|uniref:Bicupin, oxalate decarboxylase/oxidase n=1 Tax=Ceraceosorus guamensis TaxID=1522189 RepID=A0A316VZH7_9BASI|nr:Bicupin, oxalate decarboxylase/oxidase [Ceraceosorus guamensis]PWN42849.1 Bicupin, oxalate decarboxylase/oxidase [Ceraceosorus guamensis]
MIFRPLITAFVASAMLSNVLAFPAFPPATGLGSIGKRDTETKLYPKNVMEAMRKRFQAAIDAQAKDVASKYPVEHLGNVTDESLWDYFHEHGVMPQPIRGKTGATSAGPEWTEGNRENPDSYAPPNSDHGSVPQAKWPFALSHNRLQNGGWARQSNIDVLPVSTEIAGVNMRLDEGAYRESDRRIPSPTPQSHWHSTAEWAFVLNGTFRIASIDDEGRNIVADVGPGDLWYFPAGSPHTIQGISAGGGEFLLIFDDGHFSEDSTLLLTDFTAHIPREVLVKNFPGLSNDDFNNAPGSSLYIFPSDSPASNDTQQVESPQGEVPDSFTYNFSEQKPIDLPGGSVKVVDSRNFKASKTIAAVEVTIEPGAMRELHWHKQQEWIYVISGHMRVTVFSGQSNARTYNFGPGDTGAWQAQNGHYVEALGDEPVKYLEVFKSARYSDFSLSQWLALTPPAAVKAHLGFSDEALKTLYKNFAKSDHQVVKRDGPKRMPGGKRSFD